MDATASAAETSAARLGFARGQIVQELGYDDDVDLDLRDAICDLIDSDLEDEDYSGVTDATLLWWREGDGDLIDDCVDALTNLEEGGFIVLLTPKSGRDGHVEAHLIGEAARTAGLQSSTSVAAGPGWLGTRLVAPRGRRG